MAVRTGWVIDEWEGETNRSSPDYIRWVQRSLNQIIGARLAVDGISGPLTRSAVRSFQQRRRLLIDGIVGPQTEGALLAAGAAPPPGSATPPPAPTPVPPSSGGQGLAARAVQIALQELERWGRGSITESEARMQPVLRGYWETGVGQPFPGPATAWSAAFISWVMRRAGAGSAFAYSSAHTTYVGAAKRNRLANNSNPFKAYRVSEASPRVGDIVCKERQDENGNWSGVNYDNVDDGQFRSSHCDIVTAVGSGQLTTVGGNLGDSVKATLVSINAQGRITTPRYYAVIRIEESAAAQEALGYEAEDEGEFGRRRRPGRPVRRGPLPQRRGSARRPIRKLPRRPRPRPALPGPALGRSDALPEPGDGQPGPQGIERVRWVQSTLNQVLGLQLPVDGIMDRDTRSAVRSFQEKQGLPADGIVGPDTERALIEARRGASAGGGNDGADAASTSPPESGDEGETWSELEVSVDACAKIDCGRPPYPPPAKGMFSPKNRSGHRWYTPSYGDNLWALSRLVMARVLQTNGVFDRDPSNGEVQTAMDAIRACRCNAHLRGKMFLPRFKEDRYTSGGKHYGAIYIPLRFD